MGSHAASAGIWPAAASKTAFYSAATNGHPLDRLGQDRPPGAAVQGTRLTTGSARTPSWIDTAGQRGDMIIGQKTAVLRLADGRQVRMPAQALPASAQARTISRVWRRGLHLGQGPPGALPVLPLSRRGTMEA